MPTLLGDDFSLKSWFWISRSSASAGPQKPCHDGPRRGPSHGRCRGWHPGSAPWPSWPAQTCPWWRRSQRPHASPGSQTAAPFGAGQRTKAKIEFSSVFWVISPLATIGYFSSVTIRFFATKNPQHRRI